MNQPATQASFNPPWFLIAGLLAGIGLIAFIVWDTAGPGKKGKGAGGGSGNVVELTEDNWKKEVVESDIPVVVDFTATWCPPCQEFAPTVARLADRYKGKVKVCKFDVGSQAFDRAPNLARQFGINAIPFTLIFKGGDQPLRQFRGMVSEEKLAAAIEGVLATP